MHQGGLATPIGTHEHDDLPRSYPEVDTLRYDTLSTTARIASRECSQ